MYEFDKYSEKKRWERFISLNQSQRRDELEILQEMVDVQRELVSTRCGEYLKARDAGSAWRIVGWTILLLFTWAYESLIGFAVCFVLAYMFYDGIQRVNYLESEWNTEGAQLDRLVYELDKLSQLDHDISEQDFLVSNTPESEESEFGADASGAGGETSPTVIAVGSRAAIAPAVEGNDGAQREASQKKESADLLKKETVAAQINIKQTRTRAKKASVAAWPFPDTVKSVPNKKEKKSKSTTVHKTIVISYDEFEEHSWSDGWDIDPSKTTLSNKNTGEVLKVTDGLGFSEGQGFYLLYNKSRPRKLRIR